MKEKFIYFLFLFFFSSIVTFAQHRVRDYGIQIGVFNTGKYNAITDVSGVSVGHLTKIEGDDIRTGVTAIIPHQANIFRNKVPAAVYIGNGFGKLTGISQIMELGNIETPIILTNTMSIAPALDALITYTLMQKGNEGVVSVNGVVGETNDSELNNIRARKISSQDVLLAINNAKTGPVEEGCVGAGTGTVCFGFKGGIGTSSRVLPATLGGYTVGVIVQSNYGGNLVVDGFKAGELFEKYPYRKDILQDVDGSCMIVVITDAPITSRNLERLAKRAIMGLAKTGGIASNGSGDYVIAMSVAPQNLVNELQPFYTPEELQNDAMSPLFMATIEATEEALLNSLFTAKSTRGFNGREVPRLPVEQIIKYSRRQLDTTKENY
jgi:D-aminopeptidase